MKALEIALWTVGAALIAFYAGAQVWGESERRRGIATFAQSQHSSAAFRFAEASHPGHGATGSPPPPRGDTAAAPLPQDAVVAVLRIPDVALEVPVRLGTAELALRRGAGVIEGTARPGERGNVAIAAHRDTFFRSLQDLVLDDRIELNALAGMRTYRVTGLSVVDPTDVHVLADTGESVLTLVTCYPFHFVGNAPQRFIVRAVADDASH